MNLGFPPPDIVLPKKRGCEKIRSGGFIMAGFDHIPMGEKGLKEVYRWLDGFVEENKRIVMEVTIKHPATKGS
jgi:hypothetical protein